MEPSLYVAWVKQMAEKRQACYACEWDVWVKKATAEQLEGANPCAIGHHGAFCISGSSSNRRTNESS